MDNVTITFIFLGIGLLLGINMIAIVIGCLSTFNLRNKNLYILAIILTALAVTRWVYLLINYLGGWINKTTFTTVHVSVLSFLLIGILITASFNALNKKQFTV